MECADQLEKITGERCQYCSRNITVLKCEDCKKWKSMYQGADPLTKNISVYTYNSLMKEIIAKWKYRGDYLLAEIFHDAFRIHFARSFAHIKKEAVIIPIPLSKDRLFERGFNQANQLATFLTSTTPEVMERTHNEKQSKKTKLERMMTINPFRLKAPVYRPVILIDDIYTTGRTLRHAATLLKENGCPQVYAFTLIRS